MLKFTKNILLIIFIILSSIYYKNIYAAPAINCIWMPWCKDNNIESPTPPINLNSSSNSINNFLWKTISEIIKYISVIAVMSLMLWWIMFMISGWEEEKTKKAKSWIIWSLIWVFLSISAYTLIAIINNFKILW